MRPESGNSALRGWISPSVMIAVTVAFWRKVVIRARVRLGLWIMGEDYNRAVMALWLIRDRAQAAISPDGMVTLANCPPLAEVLYEQVPGIWQFSISYVEDAPSGSREGNRHG